MISKVDYCNSKLTGISGHLMDRLQSVLNSAALLILSARRTDHITHLLRQFHWWRVLERIPFRLCGLAYCCLYGTAPPYLAESLHLTTDVTDRCHLRSADSLTLLVSPTLRPSLGDRAFPVAAPRAWNKLPSSVRTASSLPVFHRDLKTMLLRLSFDWKCMYINCYYI